MTRSISRSLLFLTVGCVATVGELALPASNEAWQLALKRDGIHLRKMSAVAKVRRNDSRSEGGKTTPKPSDGARRNPRRWTEEELAAARAEAEPFWTANRAVREEYKAGRFASAARIGESYLEGAAPLRWGPPPLGMILEPMADAYFRMNQPQQAFALLAPYLADYCDDGMLLRASLAAARTGRVYPGQRDYLVSFLTRASGGPGTGDIRDTSRWMRQANTPEAIEALSCLALARQEDGWGYNCRYYVTDALRLDPGNPFASLELGLLELGTHHYAAAVQAFEAGIPRAQGRILEMMVSRRDDARYFHERTGG